MKLHHPFALVYASLAVVALGALPVTEATATPLRWSATERAATVHGPGALVAHPSACATPMAERIHSSGGAFRLPSCGGTSGRLTYGQNNAPPSATFTFNASVSNPDPTVCGYVLVNTLFAPIYYLLVSANGSGRVTFQNTSAISKIKINPFSENDYSLWALVNGHIAFGGYIGSPNSRGVFKFSSFFAQHSLPLGQTWCIELGIGP